MLYYNIKFFLEIEKLKNLKKCIIIEQKRKTFVYNKQKKVIVKFIKNIS